MRVLLLSLMESMLFILQCCFWLFDVWKHPSTAEWILSRKKQWRWDVGCLLCSTDYIWTALCAQTIRYCLFLSNNGKLLLLCITFIFDAEWARRWPVVQTSVSLKAPLVCKTRSVVWFLTGYCDWYNMLLVKNRNSRILEVNLVRKIYLYLIANYLFICININNCCEFTKSKILDFTITNGGEFHGLVVLKLKSFYWNLLFLAPVCFLISFSRC